MLVNSDRVAQSYVQDSSRRLESEMKRAAKEHEFEDAARYRDALGVALPPGLPEALLDPVEDAVTQIVRRWMTANDNFVAQQIYERLAQRTMWVTFDMAVG